MLWKWLHNIIANFALFITAKKNCKSFIRFDINGLVQLPFVAGVLCPVVIV